MLLSCIANAESIHHAAWACSSCLAIYPSDCTTKCTSHSKAGLLSAIILISLLQPSHLMVLRSAPPGSPESDRRLLAPPVHLMLDESDVFMNPLFQ